MSEKPEKSIYAEVGESSGILFATFVKMLQRLEELERRVEKMENHTHGDNVRLYK